MQTPESAAAGTEAGVIEGDYRFLQAQAAQS